MIAFINQSPERDDGASADSYRDGDKNALVRHLRSLCYLESLQLVRHHVAVMCPGKKSKKGEHDEIFGADPSCSYKPDKQTIRTAGVKIVDR